MTDEQNVPSAIPWYKSKILQGIITGVVAQLISKVQVRYNLDLSVWGITANDIVSWTMDVITALAVGYTAHARINQTVTPPTIVLTKKQAEDINTQTVKTLDPNAPPPPGGDK